MEHFGRFQILISSFFSQVLCVVVSVGVILAIQC